MDRPGQQVPAANASTQLDHILKLDINKAPACQRLTGIIATIGDATMDVDILFKMIAAGMNIALLNLAYGNMEKHGETIKMLREAARMYSEKIGRICPLAIAIRLVGRKIRTGVISDTYGDTVELKTSEVVRLTCDETYRERCSPYTVFVDFMNFGNQLSKGDLVLLDNESIMLKVEVISATTVTCKVERGGILGSYKDVYVPYVIFDMANYTEHDKADIELAIKHQVDIIIAPFVHFAAAVTELRELLGPKGKKIAIISEIQTIGGFKNFDDILSVTDGIMISRQELGTDIQPKKIVVAQKNMIARANKANKPISINAQVLSSMRFKDRPLRAELLDISNSILDGADCLVLSAETAIGLYPIEAVTTLANVCKEAEACLWTRQIFSNFVDSTPMPCDQLTATAIASVLAAHRTMSAAIIVVTTSGQSAEIVAKYRPRCPTVAVTRYYHVARHLHMYKGIIPLIFEDSPDPDWQVDLEQRVNFGIRFAMEQGFVRVGDPIVIVSGWKHGSGFTNTMRVFYATQDNIIL